jgi:thioredoxin 1
MLVVVTCHGNRAMKNIDELSEQSFDQEVLRASGPVLVDFYAPWCGPCKMLAPLLDTLAQEYAGRVKMVKVNVDDAGQLAGRYNITGVPTLLLFKAGEILNTFVGVPATRELKASLDSAAPRVAAA